MKKNKEMIMFSLIYFMTYILESFGWGLIVTYLTSVGYSTMQRSIMFASASLVALFLGFISGYLCDKYGTIKKFLGLFSILNLVAICFIYFIGKPIYILHLIAVSLLGSTQVVMSGLNDSWVLEMNEHTRNNYGRLRLYGSIGWAVGTAIIGSLVSKFGYSSIPWVTMIAMFIQCVFLYIANDATKKKQVDSLSVKDTKLLLKNKSYMMVVFMLFFAFLTCNSHDYSVIDKMTSLNTTPAQVGYYWSYVAMLELPLFFFGNKLIDKFSAINMFIFASVMLALRFIGYSLSSSYMHVMMVATLQMFTFPVLMTVSKVLVLKNVPENLKSTGLQLGIVLYSTTCSLIAPLFSGLLESSFGINTALFMIAMPCLFASVFAFMVKRRV